MRGLPILCLLLLFGMTAQAQRAMMYTPQEPGETLAWQPEVRAQLLSLLHLQDLVDRRAEIPLDAKELATHQWSEVRATELELRSTPGRIFKAIVARHENLDHPAPAIIAIHGHGGNRWSAFDLNAPIYKQFGTALASAGFVVISVDVGQHEVYEEGRTLMGERVWDLMRCVDYLQSREDVDAGRIGCAGLSLGGEMAMWLGALDTRIAAVVSSGFLTMMDQMEQDHCMCWKFDGLRELVDFPDIYALTAPRPLQCQNGLLEPVTQFHVPLARKALAEIEPAYAALAAGENLELLVHAGGHEIALPEMLHFLGKALAATSDPSNPSDQADPAAAQQPIVLMHPAQLANAKGVRLEAMLSEDAQTLIPPDPAHPSLWYAPGATSTTDEGIEIWYQRVNKGEEEYMDQRVLCLALLGHDGIFTLPALSTEPPAWGGPNNVVMRRSPHKPTWGGFNVFQMTEHAGKLWMLYWDQPAEEGSAGAMLAHAQDGRTWEKLPGTVFTEHNDAFTLLKRNGKFLLYQTMLEPWPDKPYPDNLDNFKRVLAIRHSDDLHSWTPQEVFLRPDAQDPPETEFYLMKAFPYGPGYLGIIMKYFGDPAMPNKHSAILKHELITSLDGVHWERPWRETDLGFWPYADPVEHQGKTKFVIWKDNGMNTVAYGKHRLVGAVAKEPGSFEIPDFMLGVKGVILNVDARGGSVQVEVLRDGAVVGTGLVQDLDGLEVPMPLGTVQPGPCSLRVALRHARLFQISGR